MRASPSPPLPPSLKSPHPPQIYNKNGRIGIYTASERAAIIARFQSKRTRRVWNKKIRYGCRKNLADRRLEDGPITIGVCAMHKKASSQPMMETLNRLTSFRSAGKVEFRIKFFPEETILHKPVEDWPLCEALIAFFSDGFPLKKVQVLGCSAKPLPAEYTAHRTRSGPHRRTRR